MSMNFEPFIPALSFLALVLSVGNSIWAVMTRSVRTLEGKFEKAKESAIEHDRRIQNVEAATQSLPTKDEFHRLYEMVLKADGVSAVLAERIKNMADGVQRIENALGK